MIVGGGFLNTLNNFILMVLFLISFSNVFAQEPKKENEPLKPSNGNQCRVAYAEGGKNAFLEFRYQVQSPPKILFYFDQVVKYTPTNVTGKYVSITAQIPDGKLESIFPDHKSNNDRLREAAEANIQNVELLFRICLTERKLVEIATENTMIKNAVPDALNAAYQAGLAEGAAKAEEIFVKGYVSGVIMTIQKMNQMMNQPKNEASYSSSVGGASASPVGFQTKDGAYTTGDEKNSGSSYKDGEASSTQ